MIHPDRLEGRLPELFDALAGARVPDYLDDMLRETAATRQRPRWRSATWWLRADVVKPAGRDMRPVRPLLLLALLLLALAGVAALVGSPRPAPLPAPFGPAVNGLVYHSTPEGDIVALDVAADEMRPIIAGPSLDERPELAPRGDRLVFERVVEGRRRLMVAAADGSGVRDITPVGSEDAFPESTWRAWSPAGDRIAVGLFVSSLDRTTVAVIALDGGNGVRYDVDGRVPWAVWRPGHEELVMLRIGADGRSVVSVRGLDGAVIRDLEDLDSVLAAPALTPDGTRAVIAANDLVGDVSVARLDVVDLDDGSRTTLLSDTGSRFWLPHQVAPQGDTVLVSRYERLEDNDLTSVTLSRLALDGSGSVDLGDARDVGLNDPFPAIFAAYSPDGRTVLRTYTDDVGAAGGLAAWSFPVDGGPGRILTGMSSPTWSWQRLAP